jgi:hypothetical protein
MAIRKTATLDAFTAENDPHGEHDFSSFEIAGRHFFLKLDYYDPTPEFGIGRSGRYRKDDARARHHARRRILSHTGYHTEPRLSGALTHTVPNANGCIGNIWDNNDLRKPAAHFC